MSDSENVVAYFEPTSYRVQKLEPSGWVFVSDYDNPQKASERAKDLAQFYGKKSRVVEVPK